MDYFFIPHDLDQTLDIGETNEKHTVTFFCLFPWIEMST